MFSTHNSHLQSFCTPQSSQASCLSYHLLCFVSHLDSKINHLSYHWAHPSVFLWTNLDSTLTSHILHLWHHHTPDTTFLATTLLPQGPPPFPPPQSPPPFNWPQPSLTPSGPTPWWHLHQPAPYVPLGPWHSSASAWMVTSSNSWATGGLNSCSTTSTCKPSQSCTPLPPTCWLAHGHYHLHPHQQPPLTLIPHSPHTLLCSSSFHFISHPHSVSTPQTYSWLLAHDNSGAGR